MTSPRRTWHRTSLTMRSYPLVMTNLMAVLLLVLKVIIM